MLPGFQARQNKVNQLEVSVVIQRKIGKKMQLEIDLKKCDTPELVRKKGKISHR